MTRLADHISIRPRFARSANLERDADRTEPLDGYIVTARALDAVERIATTAAVGPSGGAWSLTGPYGSGKSSLALLLDAALGPNTPARKLAWKLIYDASPAVGDLIRQAHRRHRTSIIGFHRGLVTANREPLARTLLRALHATVLRRYEEIPSTDLFREAGTLKHALDDAASTDPRRTGPSPVAIVEIAKCLARDEPLLLVVDEFGKNLEAVGDSHDADPYLLQQLAEAGQASGLPIFILTLQHLSFEDHLAHTDGPQRREWAKVQGRFEDIAYTESGSQSRALIATVFEVDDDGLRGRIREWAQLQAEAMRPLGIAELASPAAVETCYPLHPLTAMVLPELCNRYGQQERTLFSFLTGPDPASAAMFLKDAEPSENQPLPSLGLDTAYDYFVANGIAGGATAGQSSRWTEIATRLRDSQGLSRSETQLAKAVALLNLVSTTGPIRASRKLLDLVDGDADQNLSRLQAAGILTYRDFADEYRIWHGSEFDIPRLLENARVGTRRRSLVEILSEVDEPRPVVAARHSAQHDVLRVFSRRYVDGGEPVSPPDPFSPYDGDALLVVESVGSAPRLPEFSPVAKPIVAAMPEDVSALESAAREVVAISTLLGDPVVNQDWVARRELGERLAQARIQLDQAVSSTFRTDACRWILVDAVGSIELSSGRGSSALSHAADLAYPNTPVVGNEMLNRTKLTSQGAKARRLLIEAMIERGSEPGLGLSGYGPEVAMYKAFLQRPGLHRANGGDESWQFCEPIGPRLQPAWAVVEAEFDRAKTRRVNLRDILGALLSPPVGMKAGPAPVLITAALLAHKNDIAIYAHGTFQPLLTVELAERIVRNPGLFEVKHFANTAGARQEVVRALAGRLGVRHGLEKYRVANVLSVVSHLVRQMNRLENYARKARSLSRKAQRVRNALFKAIEPDELLFETLPEALGFDAVPTSKRTNQDPRQYADSLGEAVEELTGCFEAMLDELLALLLRTAGEQSRRAVLSQAAALEPEALSQDIRAFVLTLANDGVPTDRDWIQAIATVVARKAPAEWTDEDLRLFQAELPHQFAAFQRLVALHAQSDQKGTSNRIRVAMTRLDGREHIRLVGVEEEERVHVARALDNALADLATVVGSPQRAQQALLALLGERFLPDNGRPGTPDPVDSTGSRKQNG